MDNEYNYDAYQYGNTPNEEPKENTQESLQEETQADINQAEATIQAESTSQTESAEVNFVLYNPEPEKTSEEPKEEPQEEPEANQQTSQYQNVDAGPTYNYNYSNPVKTSKPKKKSKTWKKWALCVSMAIVFGIVACAVFQTGNFLVGKITGEEEKVDKTVSTTVTKGDSANKELTDVAEVASNVMPSVVSITNLSVQEVQNFFFGGTTTQETESSGSGIIIGQNDSELLIVTNNHVVEGSSTLTVFFNDGASAEAQIKGTDADIDIAVIAVPLSSIENDTLDAIKVATLGDSDALSVGEPAIAIGNALGYGQSVTSGIISAVNREIEGFDSKLIQTDAAINPGNSGGALLNASGEVIGINTVKVSADAVEGMGYAIPISDVNDIINELMNRETRTKVNELERGTLGIEGVSVSEEYSQIYGIPQGVQISNLLKGGAAEEAGLPKRGIITKFDGTSIDSMEDLQGQLEYYKAGEKVEVVVETMDESGEYVAKTYEVTLGTQSILNQ